MSEAAGLLTKSATLMPAADLPPSRARGRYHGGLLTKSKRVGTRQKRKSKIWRVRSTPQQGTGTRQKRKSKIWRVRSHPNRAQAHARKEKARFGVCGAPPNRAQAHARKEKARFDVCGATPKRKPAHVLKKNPTTIIKNKTSGNFFQPYSILLL